MARPVHVRHQRRHAGRSLAGGSSVKPLVYVAGPITGAEIRNTQDAVRVATRLRDGEHGDGGVVVPHVPHLTVLWDMIDPASYERWLAHDFDVIEHCHALFRMPGESKGADREVEYATKLGIPVFRDVQRLEAWAVAGWWKR